MRWLSSHGQDRVDPLVCGGVEPAEEAVVRLAGSLGHDLLAIGAAALASHHNALCERYRIQGFAKIHEELGSQ